jgi:hypothetical protein
MIRGITGPIRTNDYWYLNRHSPMITFKFLQFRSH